MTPSIIRTLAGVAVLAGALSACGSAERALPTATACNLSQYAQRLVSVSASIGTDRSGQAVLTDPACASVQIPLRFTAAAARTGVADQLTAALKAAGNAPVTAQLTGVFTSDAGPAFTAETMTGLAAPAH